MLDKIKPCNVQFSLPAGPVTKSGALKLILRLFGDPISKSMYKIFERQIDELHLDVANDLIRDVPVSTFFSE